jgi:hypothetical protein
MCTYTRLFSSPVLAVILSSYLAVKRYSTADARRCCNVELVCAEPATVTVEAAHIITAKCALGAGATHYIHWIVSCLLTVCIDSIHSYSSVYVSNV